MNHPQLGITICFPIKVLATKTPPGRKKKSLETFHYTGCLIRLICNGLSEFIIIMYSPKITQVVFQPYMYPKHPGADVSTFFSLLYLGHKILCPQVTCKPHLHQLLRIHVPASLMPLSNAPRVVFCKNIDMMSK